MFYAISVEKGGKEPNDHNESRKERQQCKGSAIEHAQDGGGSPRKICGH